MTTRTDATTTWSVKVEGWSPSDHNRAMRMHHFARRKELKRAVDWITSAAAEAGEPIPRFVGHVRVRVTRIMGYRQRELDHDGLHSWCKVILDAIRRPSPRARHGLGLCIIEDDRPSRMYLRRPRQVRGVSQAGEKPAPGFIVEVTGILEGGND